MKKLFKDMVIDDEFILLFYAAVLPFMLIAYLIPVVLKCNEFDFAAYKNAYMYYMIFEFVLFSLSIIHIKTDEKFSPKSILKNFFSILLFCIINIPFIFVIFICGNISIMNFAAVLFIQLIFGMAVISFKNVLEMNSKSSRYAEYITHFIVFFTDILSLAFLYIYYKYSNAVITTVYDKRIPKVFFLNPLFTAGGYINKEITNYTQIGILPLIYCCIFWSAIAFMNILILCCRYKKQKERM